MRGSFKFLMNYYFAVEGRGEWIVRYSAESYTRELAGRIKFMTYTLLIQMNHCNYYALRAGESLVDWWFVLTPYLGKTTLPLRKQDGRPKCRLVFSAV